ncbi:MAG: GNAT family N-acetyltransferase [Ferruginibacter sp.]|nr:GNAT family N-acetyltransferase [Cytophagales bacterium]
MLYQSLYVPKDGAPFERNIVNQADIARYVKDWGRADDSGFVAVDENDHLVGAVWLRLFKKEEKGFGYVDDKTPELGVAVSPEYRGKGIGTVLLSRLIKATEDIYECISLSVTVENPALRLYQRLGFEAVAKCGDSITMKRKSKTCCRQARLAC